MRRSRTEGRAVNNRWEDGLVGVVVTIKVQDGKGVEFERIFRNLTATVNADEPGCLCYQLTRSRTEANTYKVIELHRDQDALTQHLRSDYFRTAVGRLKACMVPGPPQVEQLDAVE